MSDEPGEYSYIRYLAAKKALDDRSLNPLVRKSLTRHLLENRKKPPLRVLEVGCGTGTMLERLIDWHLLPEAAYTGLDLNPDYLMEAGARLRRFAASRGAGLEGAAGRFHWQRQHLSLSVAFEAVDLFDFLARRQERAAWDLIIAHALLDLVDLKTAIPALLALLAPGGFFYFTLNFDGVTVFEPGLEPSLDRLIECLYHRCMDERRVAGRPSGSSQTGRRLPARLGEAGATILASGSSNWLVLPGQDGYPDDEAYFLHFIIHTVHQALSGHPELPAAAFRSWVEQRHAQVERWELTYLARQLDFFGRV